MKLAGHPAPSQVLRDVAAPAGALPAARDRIGDHQRPPERAGGNHRGWNGAPGRSRTCDPRIRSPMLYPTELQARPFKLIRCVFRGALFSGRRRICAASDGLIARKERKANFSAEAPETRSGRAGQMWVGAALVI